MSRLTLDEAVSLNIADIIPNDVAAALLSNPPFIPIPNLINARDLSNGTEQACVKPHHIFRSGSLELMSPSEMAELSTTLKITTIFDLRSQKETLAHPDPDIEGIANIWSPSTDDNPTTTGDGSKSDYTQWSFQKMYLGLLNSHRASFRDVFMHILTKPNEPFLFHCTAGKDRTGVLAALVLGVSGAPLEYINRDYALTRIGIEPVRDVLMGKLGAAGVDLNSEIMQKYAAVPLHVFTDVFEELERIYGGVDGYVRQALGFDENEVATMKINLKGSR